MEAIVAENLRNKILVLFRHYMCGHVLFDLFVHARIISDTLLAKGTRVEPSLDVLLEAILVDRMATAEVADGVAGGKETLLTYRTVDTRDIGQAAGGRVVSFAVDAIVAHFAVSKVFLLATAAQTAIFAMEDIAFGLSVEKLAFVTVVTGHGEVAVSAVLLHWLSRGLPSLVPASETHHLRYRFPVNHMFFVAVEDGVLGATRGALTGS